MDHFFGWLVDAHWAALLFLSVLGIFSLCFVAFSAWLIAKIHACRPGDLASETPDVFQAVEKIVARSLDSGGDPRKPARQG